MAHPQLVGLLTGDIASLVLDYISPYCKGDQVWSYFHDPAFGAPELRRAKVIGFDTIHGLYLLSWLDAIGRDDSVERTADYIFPCVEDSQELLVDDLVWAEHEFGPCRMFEARVASVSEGSFIIQPLDEANCFGNNPIVRPRHRLLKLEPPPQLYTGDICWAERSCPMKTYSQIFRAEVLSFSLKDQLYTVKWLDTFGSECLPSVVTQFQLMPYISQPQMSYEVGDRALSLYYDGYTSAGTIVFANNGLFHLKLDDKTEECRTLDLLRNWHGN